MKTLSRCCVVVVCLIAQVAFGQEISGNLNGRVTDNTGAVIPGVSVTLSGATIQGAREMVTDESGNYRYILLPPGDGYVVKFELPGFKTLVREGVIIQVGRTTTIPVTMEVATVAETVTVTGESPVVDVQNATLANVYNQTMLRDLPASRDIWVVLGMTPGVRMGNPDVGGSHAGTQTGYSAYGRSGQNTVNLDGVITTEGTSAAGFYMNYGAFEEINISAAGNSAEVATPGVFINTVVKSGSNKLKGEMYADWQSDKFQGENVTDRLLDGGIVSGGDKFVRYNDFNGNLGGPFKKDKFWWFTSIRNQYVSLATNLLKDDPVFTGPESLLKVTPGGGPFYTSLQNETFKFTYSLSPRNQLSTTIEVGRKLQPYRSGSGSGARNNTESTTSYQDSWSWVHSYKYTGIITNRATLDVSLNNFDLFFPLKAHNTPAGKAARISDSDTSAVRGGISSPNLTQRRRWHVNANLSYFKDNFLGGNHDVKFGYGYLFEDSRVTSWGKAGDPTYAPMGHITFRYQSGRPRDFTINDTPGYEQNVLNQNFLFVQDRWQIGRRLTLNLGFRYDRYASFYPETPAFGRKGTVRGPWVGFGTRFNGNRLFDERPSVPRRDMPIFNDPVPRLAFVYDVFGDGKTALKMNWGIFGENTGTWASTANPIANRSAQIIWDGTLPITPEYVQRQLSAAQNNLTSAPSVTTPPEIDPNLTNAKSQEYTVGIDQQLVNDFGVTATFVRKFRYNTYDSDNIAKYQLHEYRPRQGIDMGKDGIIGTSDDQVVSIFERMVPTRSSISRVRNFHESDDNWSSVELTFTKRMSHKWMAAGGWNWSKSNSGGTTGFDPNTLLYQYGHTTTWGFRANGIYQLPKGVQFSAVFSSDKGDNYGRSASFQGNNSTSGVTGVSLRNILRLDGTCCETANFSQGSQSINVERTGTYHVDNIYLLSLRSQKTFSLNEKFKLDAMFDLYNVLNAAPVLDVQTNSTTVKNRKGNVVGNWGRFNTMLNPIVFRLGARLKF